MARPSSAETPPNAASPSVIRCSDRTASSVCRSSSMASRNADCVRANKAATVPSVPAPRAALADATAARIALVMGEHQVEASPMYIEGRAEVLERHRVAFGMPPGSPGSPGARPGRLALLRSLPEGEVQRVFLLAGLGHGLHDDVLDFPMG